MTSLFNAVHVTKEKYLTDLHNQEHTSITKKSKHILKTKNNSHNIRCNRELKRKLKKYKLRHDGKEDQDILDMSDILITSLKIKSPKSSEKNQSSVEDIGYIRPKNYLFKMGRQNSRTNGVKSDKSKVKPVNKNNIEEVNHSMQSDNHLRKQTNAFQLLMDSRNKVIGSNSPGKEKASDEDEEFKVLEKKELKKKRLLLLQKMAEDKGSLKKSEMEEYQNKCINRKMEERAQKLKSMILNKETKTKKNVKKTEKINNGENTEVNGTTEAKEINVKLNSLQLVNMFDECERQVNFKTKKKEILKEDEEFLKKLSPSLKKKENMLSYFKKVDKEVVTTPEKSDSDSLVIKVKLKTKKKKKLSLKKRTDISKELLLIKNDDINKIDSVSHNLKICEDNEQKENLNTLVAEPIKTNVTVLVDKERPKRSYKRPVKYIDDFDFSSSDEDGHIFTPKKKKSTQIQLKSKSNTKNISLSISKNHDTKKVCLEESQKKHVKIAPIFATKIQPCLADIEAKNKFLQSGVPEQLKKKNTKHDTTNLVKTYFPITVHVQQNIENAEDIIKEPYTISFLEMPDENCSLQPIDELFRCLININTESTEQKSTLPIQDINTTLKNIKQINQRFPVYRTYRLLKDKCKGDLKEHSYLELDNSLEMINSFTDIYSENLDQLNWTSKYKPTSSKQIIGNFESIKELRKWLVQWTENEARKKTNSKSDSDFSDFYHSDTDSRGSMKATNNLLIITGPVGCGKTSGVYAVAAELSIKVLEVNASSKRTGKIMLQDLHEATQSHKVNRGTSSIENSQKSQDFVVQPKVSKLKKRGRPKKCKEKLQQICSETQTDISNGMQSSLNTNRTAMSLILIDDADIVFEQDDGFSSAIVQLVQCSKRPVIVITSNQSCLHLQRFLQIGKIIKMKPLLPRMLGTWLDLLCLVNNGVCWPGIGAKFLDYFKGDVRKTINYLQFYSQTEISNDDVTTSPDVDINSQHFNDEKSNISWVDQADAVEMKDFDFNQVWSLFTGYRFDLGKARYNIPLFTVWWSIPTLLKSFAYKCDKAEDQGTKLDSNTLKEKLGDLESFANAIDAVSVSDMFCVKTANNVCLTNLPWFSAESNSVSEHVNLENYTRAYELSEEISQEYVKNNILLNMKCESSRNVNMVLLDFPGMKKWR